MKRLWQILALLLLALMAPASVCCLGPKPVESHECGCCSSSDEHQEAPAQPDACPSDTIARSQLPAAMAMPEMQMVELCDLINPVSRLRELTAQTAAPTPFLTVAPPELRTTWVFVSRAALPARAPSELA